MIKASAFLEQCLERSFDFITGTPCSYLKPLINSAIDLKKIRFVDAVNEGDAVAIAAGATMAGQRCVVMFQNSGLGNAVNPLTSLAHIFRVPLLLIVTHRGEPGGKKDQPQHEFMGSELFHSTHPPSFPGRMKLSILNQRIGYYPMGVCQLMPGLYIYRSPQSATSQWRPLHGSGC